MTIARNEKTTQPASTPSLMDMALERGSRPFSLLERQLLPAWNGGMRIDVYARRNARSVLVDGGVGIIASIDRRGHHADFLERAASLEAA